MIDVFELLDEASPWAAVVGPRPSFLPWDHFIVAFSGGKDSMACLLLLLLVGVPLETIELWHYDVDGREGSTLFDWPCTRAYVRAVAAAFGVPIRFAWKVGGIEREMLRNDVPTAPTRFETPDGAIVEIGGKGPRGTRLKYPQVAADLSARYCSAYAKIDVAIAAIRNQPRFDGTRTVLVTGERAEESTSRAHYKVFERDKADGRSGRRRRHVDHLRPVHAMSEAWVWKIIERFRVNPHPAYRLGWSRVSCMKCIFGGPNQWASIRAIDPAGFGDHAAYERRFGRTIHRKLSVVQQADRGVPYPMRTEDIRAALSETFDEPVFLDTWTLPAGAFSENCGPS